LLGGGPRETHDISRLERKVFKSTESKLVNPTSSGKPKRKQQGRLRRKTIVNGRHIKGEIPGLYLRLP